MYIGIAYHYRALKRISSVQLKHTSLPAVPYSTTNCEVPEGRRASTLVPSLPDSHGSSSTTQQLMKPNHVIPRISADETEALHGVKSEGSNNADSGIILDEESTENPDFMYPRVYRSTLNVVIK